MKGSDISFVVQGPLVLRDDLTKRALISIRREFPGAELILSTWKGQPHEGLDYDKLVLSDDPGPIIDANGELINFNRQLISTQAGLLAATLEYAVKFRADFLLANDHFCALPLQPCTGYFHSKIRMTNLFVQNPLKMPFIFHLSDLVHFGRREDVTKFWSLPVYSREEALNLDADFPAWVYSGGSIQRMRAEQALPLGFLKTQGIAIAMNHPNDFDLERYAFAETFLTENFEVVDWRESGIVPPSRMMDSFLETVFTPADLDEIARTSELAAKRFATADFRRRYLFPFHRAYLFHLKKSLVYRMPALRALFTALKRVQRLIFGAKLQQAQDAKEHLERIAGDHP